MVRWLTTTALSAMFLTLSAPAWADDAAFGDKGEFILSADRLMGLVGFTSTKFSNTMGSHDQDVAELLRHRHRPEPVGRRHGGHDDTSAHAHPVRLSHVRLRLHRHSPPDDRRR